MSRASVITTEQALAADQPASFVGQRTARRALEILVERDARYRVSSRAEGDALLVGYAMVRKALVGAAFDAVRVEGTVDFTDPHETVANMDAITICKIKSTNRASLAADLKGYFFNVTAAELITAQSLGAGYRFVFVNTVTGEHQEMGLTEVFGRARGMYPAWHIRF